MLQIVNGVPTWGEAPAGGGGGPIEWHPMTDIWTPATGTGPSPFAHPARYAVDGNFLYLGGDIIINRFPGVSIDASTHPVYILGSLHHSPVPGSRPTLHESMNSWLCPAILDGAYPNTVVELQVAMPYALSPVTDGVFGFNVASDNTAIAPGATVTLSLDGIALPWQ